MTPILIQCTANTSAPSIKHHVVARKIYKEIYKSHKSTYFFKSLIPTSSKTQITSVTHASLCATFCAQIRSVSLNVAYASQPHPNLVAQPLFADFFLKSL